jgi:hypothetical protein
MHARHQARTNPCIGGDHARANVRCATYDAELADGARVDLTQAEPVSVRMAFDRGYLCDYDIRKGGPRPLGIFDFDSSEREPPANLIYICVNGDELAQPSERQLHAKRSPVA